MTRKPLIAGNWKMNIDHFEAVSLIQKLAWSLKDVDFDYSKVDVAVFPPFTDLRTVQTLIQGEEFKIQYGAQDIAPVDTGAYTGDVSGAFLRKLGCTYVLVGHSERRNMHSESEELLNQKLKAVYRNDMIPVLCVGENLEVRQAKKHIEYTLDQLRADLKGITTDQAMSLIVAYEPVWAIGTGEVATVDDAQEMGAAIRQELGQLYDQSVADKVRILYGGSVKADNTASIVQQKDIDGVLVGGASLDPLEFSQITRFESHVIN